MTAKHTKTDHKEIENNHREAKILQNDKMLSHL